MTLDSWGPVLRGFPKQGPGPHEVPTPVPRHAGCHSPLSPSASSRSPSGLGCRCSRQSPASHHLHPDCQCRLLPGFSLACTVPLFSISTAFTSPGPIHFLIISPCPPHPTSIPYLQPERGFSEKTQVTPLLSAPQWLHMPSGQKANPPAPNKAGSPPCPAS